MADDRLLLVRYFANAARGDNNDRIRLQPDPETAAPRELVLNGDPVLVTLEEYNRIAQYWSVAVVDEDGNRVESDAPESVEAATIAPPTTAGTSAAQPSGDASRSSPQGAGETAQTETTTGGTRSPSTSGR